MKKSLTQNGFILFLIMILSFTVFYVCFSIIVDLLPLYNSEFREIIALIGTVVIALIAAILCFIFFIKLISFFEAVSKAVKDEEDDNL